MVEIATLTEFLRTPKAVIAKTDTGSVRITRRDAADLIVMRAGDLDRQEEGIGLASRLMRACLASRGDMVHALEATFAWTSLLSTDEMHQFAADMDRHIWSAAELGRYEALLQEFRSWEGTAEAYADGMPRGRGDDVVRLEESIDVERP